MNQRLGRLVVLLAAALVLCGVGLAQAPEGQGGGRGEGGAVFAGGQMVRGTVTAVSSDHVTVKTDAGEVYQIVTTANTWMMKDRQPVKLADVKVGDGVGAMGEMDAPTKTVHALFMTVMDAEQVKKMREGLGKLYITGKVTAIDADNLKITVARPDGVSQVIEVDEGTSFKRGGRGMMSFMNGSGPVGNGSGAGGARSTGMGSGSGSGSGGESITLADVKVGDTVAGPGAVKNGVFVPTELGVVDASAMRQGRRRAAEGSAPSAAAGSTAAAGTGAAPAAATPKQ
jgi:hypothetical protein